jgi:hypothetical protein
VSRPRPQPILTDHVRERCRRKGIGDSAVAFVCRVAPVDEYDDVNESYRLDQWVTGGHLCVAIEAKAYDERGQFIVKTAYWLSRSSAQ